MAHSPTPNACLIKNTCLKWLLPFEWTTNEVAEDVCVHHYVALLQYKPKMWVTCHQFQSLEDAVLLMEGYIYMQRPKCI